MQLSYSRISTYEKCPYQFKLRYLDGLQTIFNCDPQNALVLGHALHTGIEKDVQAAISEYYSAYPVIRDAHVTEAMKLEYLIPKVKALLPDGEHEVKIETPDFVGFIDLLVPVEDICGSCEYMEECCSVFCGEKCQFNSQEYYDIYDFKYSSNVKSYMESAQLHLYKYFFELTNPGKRIRNLYFVFIPKCNLKMKYKNKTNPRDETIYEFRKRCMADLEAKKIIINKVDYEPNKVIDYLISSKHCIEETEYSKNENRLCDWCEYQSYCQKGQEYMILPENHKREKTVITNPDMWIYGDSYVGKSVFVDQIENLLFLNTDGNTENTTSPVIRIRDTSEKSGRMTSTKMAWENFLDVISELEKKENTFETVAIDLIEDLYEHCRLYTYKKLGIEHEQDAGFGKGWDMVRTGFLSAIKRLKNLGYRIIYISKEIATEVNLKGGGKITTYSPNIPDKVANVLAGTVTLTVRAFMNNRGRFLQLEKTESVFGGGRFNFLHDICKLDMKEFVKELKLAQGEKAVEKPVENVESQIYDAENKETTVETETPTTESEVAAMENTDAAGQDAEKPKRKTRKKREE